MAILSFRKHSLRTRDDKRTPASELTLRQSIFPLCLVTILFFLWVPWLSWTRHTIIVDPFARVSRMDYSTP